MSLRLEEAIATTLKIMMDHGGYGWPYARGLCNKNKIKTAEATYGATLIVVCTRDDALGWERALREQTAFSVINYATSIPPSERERMQTATWCAGCDVVLSTFDAIKTRDIALLVDQHAQSVAHKHHNQKNDDDHPLDRVCLGPESSNRPSLPLLFSPLLLLPSP